MLRRVLATTGGPRSGWCSTRGPTSGITPCAVRRDDGVWTARSGRCSCAGRAERRTSTPAGRRAAGGRVDRPGGAPPRPRPGDLRPAARPAPPPDPDRPGTATEDAWSRAVPATRGTDRPPGRPARLRGAARAHQRRRRDGRRGHMCLPERAGGRNYDYRYAWIRDQCYAGQAVGRRRRRPAAGRRGPLHRRTAPRRRAAAQPAYTVDGGPVPDERTLDLPGYPGGGDKVGNWVNDQFQLDASARCCCCSPPPPRQDRLDARDWRAVADHRRRHRDSAARSRRRDVGARQPLVGPLPTHLRGRAARRRGHAPAGGGRRLEQRWPTHPRQRARDCLHPTGRGSALPTTPRVDAALLLPAIRGALPAETRATVATLRSRPRELAHDGYVYRFRQTNGRWQAEGAFLLCGFIIALALHQRADEAEAMRWFERNRAACGPPGLLAEEYDVAQRQLRGNLPQAFVHALLLEAAHRLGEPWPTHRPARDRASTPHRARSANNTRTPRRRLTGASRRHRAGHRPAVRRAGRPRRPARPRRSGLDGGRPGGRARLAGRR